MPSSGGKAVGYGILGAGVIVAWAALINRSVLGTLQDLIAGKQPVGGPGFQVSNKTTGKGSLDPSVTTLPTLNAQDEAKSQLGQRGWQGQFSAFNSLEMGEAGYNPTAKNPSSGAFGVAQALGHGTSGTNGTMANEYGGYGLSTEEARQANSGVVRPQFKWMMNYIAAVYGDPNHAYARWLSRNPHWY